MERERNRVKESKVVVLILVVVGGVVVDLVENGRWGRGRSGVINKNRSQQERS